MHGSLAEILIDAVGIVRAGWATGGRSDAQMLGGTKGRSMQKLESLGGAGILDAAEGGRGRLEAKFGGDRRGPGGGGVASGVGDAVGVE